MPSVVSNQNQVLTPLKALFLAEPATLAHVARSFVLANELANKGVDVTFATGDFYNLVTKDSKIPVIKIPTRNPLQFQKILTNRGIIFDEQILSGYISQEIALIEKYSPDIIFGDMRPSLGVSCPKMGVPLVTITNAYWSPYRTETEFPLPFFPPAHLIRYFGIGADFLLSSVSKLFNSIAPKILSAQATGLDNLREKFGFEAFPDYLTGFTYGDSVLYADLPSVAPCGNLPANHHYIGPVCWSPKVETPDWWQSLSGDRKIVYVSLGSSGEISLVSDIIQAAKEIDAWFVISTAGRFKNLDMPSNCFSADFLPGDLIAAASNLVITNGGSPGAYQAFSAGVPILGIAFNMDQLLCMKGIVQTKAGTLLRADIATKTRLKKSICDILESPVQKRAATQMKSEIESLTNKRNLMNIINEISPIRNVSNG